MYGYLGDNEAALDKWLVSNLRRVWVMHPARLGKIERARFRKLGKDRRGRHMLLWHVTCEHCNKATREYEVNHKNTVLSIKDFGRFCTNLLKVKEKDLEILCKTCHEIITYMERSGMSFEDAKIEKKVIKFGKLAAAQQKARLLRAGITEETKNAKQRKDAVRRFLKTGNS